MQTLEVCECTSVTMELPRILFSVGLPIQTDHAIQDKEQSELKSMLLSLAWLPSLDPPSQNLKLLLVTQHLMIRWVWHVSWGPGQRGSQIPSILIIYIYLVKSSSTHSAVCHTLGLKFERN